jgi:hypothetical protein
MEVIEIDSDSGSDREYSSDNRLAKHVAANGKIRGVTIRYKGLLVNKLSDSKTKKLFLLMNRIAACRHKRKERKQKEMQARQEMDNFKENEAKNRREISISEKGEEFEICLT